MTGAGVRRCSGLIGMCGAGLIALAALPGTVWGEEMLYPLSVAVAGDDALLVADRMLPGLLKLQAGSTEVFFQGKKTFRTPLNAVRAVAVAADGTVHAADSATRDVFKFVDGQPVPLTQGKIGIPVDIAFDPSGGMISPVSGPSATGGAVATGGPSAVVSGGTGTTAAS